MNRIRSRLSDTQAWTPVFVLIVFVIYAWSIYFTLQQIPAWILRNDLWDLVGNISYLQFFALLESLALLVFCLFWGMFLPEDRYHKNFPALAGIFFLVSAGWAGGMHLATVNIGAWKTTQFLAFGGLYGLSIAAGLLAAWKVPVVGKGIKTIAQRLAVLSYLYFGISLVATLIVLIRNIAGWLSN